MRCVWRSRLFVVTFAASVVGCGGLAAYSDSGVGDGSTAPFDLDAGTHRIEYRAVDREPFFGRVVSSRRPS